MSRLAVIIVMVSTLAIITALQCFFGDLWETWGYLQKTLTILSLLLGWEGLRFSRRVDGLIDAQVKANPNSVWNVSPN